MVNIEPMGAADFTLFALLALANASLLGYLRMRRQRRNRQARMMRSLRAALRREAVVVATADRRELMLAS